jgi:hypothetical protein
MQVLGGRDAFGFHAWWSRIQISPTVALHCVYTTSQAGTRAAERQSLTARQHHMQLLQNHIYLAHDREKVEGQENHRTSQRRKCIQVRFWCVGRLGNGHTFNILQGHNAFTVEHSI